MERYRRADDERASSRLVFAAATSGVLFAAMFLAFCVAGRLARFPWSAFSSLGGVAMLIAVAVWKMSSAADTRATETGAKLHELVCKDQLATRSPSPRDSHER